VRPGLPGPDSNAVPPRGRRKNGLARRLVPCIRWKLAARSFGAGCKGDQCAEGMHVVGLRVFFELLIFESAEPNARRHRAPLPCHGPLHHMAKSWPCLVALNCHESHLLLFCYPLAPLRTVTRPLCRLLPPYNYTTACYN
jgi:hypothetical protein